MNPTLVDTIIKPDLTTLQQSEPSAYSTAMSASTAAAMTEAMVADVANGVASNARIEGVDVAGKTGTAENGSGESNTLWFTGFAPAQDAKVAVAVVLEDGGGEGPNGVGNLVAAPIAKKVIEAVLNK
jgi:peptidoglycan glycosyltransferase